MSNTGPNNAYDSPLPSAMQDRREYQRIHVKWKAVIQAGGTRANVIVMEISDVGFGFIGDIAYKIGATLSFELNMPDPLDGAQRHLVLGQAEVINSVLTREGFRAGVTLKSINSKHQDLLKTWVKVRTR